MVFVIDGWFCGVGRRGPAAKDSTSRAMVPAAFGVLGAAVGDEVAEVVRREVSAKYVYLAGLCLPLQGPAGWRGQNNPVIIWIVLNPRPQYLHLYSLFSEPSYGACFSLQGPLG